MMVLMVHTDVFLADAFVDDANLSVRLARLVCGVGWTGVDLFFVISGMLITGILLDSKGGSGYFKSFYARRTLRIFPLYYLAIVVMTIVLPAVATAVTTATSAATFDAPGVLGPREETWSLWWYVSNIAVARAESWSVIPPLTTHFWSLAVEEQFYLLWPFIVWKCSPRVVGRIAIALLFAAPVLRVVLTHSHHTLGTLILLPTRVDALAIGALIALTARRPQGLDRWLSRTRWILPISALIFVLIVWRSGGPGNYGVAMQRWGLSAIAIGWAALLILVLKPDANSLIQRIFTLRWLRFVGRRSYGVYAWHPVGLYALLYLRAPTRVPFFPLPVAPKQVLLYPLLLGGSLLAAELSWRAVEAPFLALKRYVPRVGPKGSPVG